MKVPSSFHISLKPFLNPEKKPLKSWWAEPSVQTDRAAFQKRLVTEELDRMAGAQRFGGSKVLIDKFPTKQKQGR